MPGHYIVIEGHDGTGKSTQVDMLAEHLRGQGEQVVVVEEPGSDDPDKSVPIADDIRTIIKNGLLERSGETDLLLFTAARRELWLQKIAPALEAGAWVLASRNYYSTLAYQGGGDGVATEDILGLTARMTDPRYMRPDHMFVLHLANHTERALRIANRGELANPDTFESRDDMFQNAVSESYLQIARKRQATLIDATVSVDEIHDRITKVLSIKP
jgi:dTMP kinase